MTPRAQLLTAVVVVSNVAGNLSLSVGVKTPNTVLIVLGVALLILWTLSRMALMSWADLSYILPVTSVGYILTALAGKYVLAEHISGARWWGTLLIFAGMVVVSRTSPRTNQ
jgi:uncharacterized membrane protein